MVVKRGAHRQAGFEGPDQGRVDARRGHAARCLSAGLSQLFRREFKGRQNYRLEVSVAGSSIIARWLPSEFQNGIDIDAVDGAVNMPYDIPNYRVEYVRAEPPAVPTGFWRGVGPNNNVLRDRKLHGRAGA